jgi:fused signal recognition particle receptor
MGLLDRFKAGLQKTHSKLVHEIQRVVTRSPRLTGSSLEELEAVLLGADLGTVMAARIVEAVRRAYETQGRSGLDVFEIACAEVEHSFANSQTGLNAQPTPPTVVSLVGVNGTGKTTTAAKLAHFVQAQGHSAILAACDTFRAAAIEQLKLWGQRVRAPVVSGADGADPAAVAHDAIAAAQARGTDYLFVDTAGRQHTRQNLMLELQKVHRVMDKKLAGAPHEVLLVLDGSTGMNAANQAREFHKIVPLTGLIVTKLDGTSKGGIVVAIHRELELPVKFVGLGEQPDDLQPFVARQFAEALLSNKE